MEQGVLYKHHVAVHAGGSLSLIERKIINALIYHASANLKTQPEHAITVARLLQIIQLKTRNYTKIYQSIRNLARTLIEWGVLKASSFEGELTGVTFFEMYHIKNGLITYRFPKELISLFYEPSRYAKLSLTSIAQLKSSYGVALYENCASYDGWGDTGWISIDDFRRLMGIEKKYPIYRDLKRRIIQTAIKDVNAFTEYSVTLLEQKEHNRTSKIKFTVKKQQEKVVSIVREKQNSSLQDTHIIEALNEYGINRRKAMQWLEQYDETFIKDRINYVNEYQGAKNKAALLVAAIEQHYAIVTEKKSGSVKLSIEDYQRYVDSQIEQWLTEFQDTEQWPAFCSLLIEYVRPVHPMLEHEFKQHLHNQQFWKHELVLSDVKEYTAKMLQQWSERAKQFAAPSIMNVNEFVSAPCPPHI